MTAAPNSLFRLPNTVALRVQIKLEFRAVRIYGGGGGEPEYPKKTQTQDENDQETQPTYLHLGQTGGRRVLLPMCHPCSH